MHAGHSFAGNVINKASTARDNEFDALFWSGWRDQKNRAEVRFLHPLLIALGFLGRKIEYQQTIHACLSCGLDKFLKSKPVQQIEVDVENDRYLQSSAIMKCSV